MSEIGINNYDLNDIYNIKNPLEDDRIIEQIIKMKSKDGTLHYSDIQGVNSQGFPKDGVSALYYFYAYMFNVWKDNFLSLDSKELGPKSQKLQKVLEKYRNIKKVEDVDEEIAKAFRCKDDEMIVKSINEGKIDEDLVDAISKVRWNNSETQMRSISSGMAICCVEYGDTRKS